MSFISARLGALRRSVAAPPSLPSLVGGGGGGGGGGKASNSPRRRIGEDDDGDRRRRPVLNAVARAAVFVAAPLAASRSARAGPASPRASAAPSEGGLEKIKSGLKGAGLSVLLGYAAAALIKTVGKTVALLLLAVYALASYLTHKKFLSLDWEGMLKKAGSKATWLLDVDRDGSLGVGDVKAAVNKASKLMGRTKLSSGAAFVAGLAWGLGVLPMPI